MRILQVHNYYRQPGGEDAVVAAEAQLLREHGHQVELFAVDNRQLVSPWQKLLAASRVIYSRKARQALQTRLKDFQPDLVHVHNFFPLLTPSVYDACREADIPVVQTLHNYRLLCANALFLRQGRVCEDCLTMGLWQSVRHGCYQGSRLGSLAVALMLFVHRHRQTWQRKVDRFIVLSPFARDKFVTGGLPADKIVVKPNFSADPGGKATTPRREYALFVGRIGQEKGVHTLLEAWQGLEFPLRVVGDGPLAGLVQQAANPAITWLGPKSPVEVAGEMAGAAVLVLPSICYEGLPLALIEAFSQRLPVIASRLGSLTDLVAEGTTGLLFSPGHAGELAEKVQWAFGHPNELQRMGDNARRTYEEQYCPECNYRLLLDIYQNVIDEKTKTHQHRH